MTIGEIAVIRTGLVTTRTKKTASGSDEYTYEMLNLKCISQDGYIDIAQTEEYRISKPLKDEYFTKNGDILIRLSTPYTPILINKSEWCGLVVPSHFAIIRADQQKVLPEYLFWTLRREKNRIAMIQNSSGSAVLGTIGAGVIASLPITLLPLEQQCTLGKMILLSEKEQELLDRLSTEKKKYNTLLLNIIYDNMKRGNGK